SGQYRFAHRLATTDLKRRRTATLLAAAESHRSPHRTSLWLTFNNDVTHAIVRATSDLNRHARVARCRKLQAIPRRDVVTPANHRRRCAERVRVERRFCAGACTAIERTPLRIQPPPRQTSV